MAIYGIGAKYNGHEVSQIFIRDSIVANRVGRCDCFREISIGDIVYIKSCS